MLNSGKIFFDLHDKKINILTLVLSEKKFLNEIKNHNPPPPFQVKWSVPKQKEKKDKKKRKNRNKLSRSVANGKQYEHQNTLSYSSQFIVKRPVS